MVRNMCLRESIKQTISFGSRFLIQTKRETAFKEPQKIERQGQDSNDFSFYRSTVEYSALFCGANWRRSFAAFLPCGIATGGGEMHRHSCLQQKNDSANATFMLCSLHLLHYMGLLPEVVKPPIHPPSHSPIHAFNQSMIDSLVHPIHFFKRSPMHQIFFFVCSGMMWKHEKSLVHYISQISNNHRIRRVLGPSGWTMFSARCSVGNINFLNFFVSWKSYSWLGGWC